LVQRSCSVKRSRRSRITSGWIRNRRRERQRADKWQSEAPSAKSQTNNAIVQPKYSGWEGGCLTCELEPIDGGFRRDFCAKEPFCRCHRADKRSCNQIRCSIRTLKRPQRKKKKPLKCLSPFGLLIRCYFSLTYFATFMTANPQKSRLLRIFG
jgi:hypothetical protein